MNYNINFTKYDACGNKLILIDEITQNLIPEARKIKIAQKICDKQFGAISDGLLYIAKSPIADFKMRMFNPDGTEDMCGNGLRCAAKYFFTYLKNDKKEISIETISGIKKATQLINGQIEINMSKPITKPSSLPLRFQGSEPPQNKFIRSSLTINKKIFDFLLLSTGTPHVVIISDKKTIKKYFSTSAQIENNIIFSEKVNVDWIEILDRKNINIRIWERGVGETLSCGTGACASMAAAKLLGLVDRKVKMHFKGGDIFVSWKEEDDAMYMKGMIKKIYKNNKTLSSP